MIGWTPEQVAAAIGVIVAALACNAVVLARAYAQVRDIVEGLNRSGVPVRGARGPSGGSGSNRVVEYRAAAPASQLLPLDPVNQRTAVTVSATPAPTGAVDCGPACVVSCIEDVKGCWSADELLRLRYFGSVDNRLTTARDLVGMLLANSINAHAREGVSSDVARQEITRNWASGRPSIILGDWVSRGVGHWVKFVGDRGGAVVMDPWYGTQRTIPWDKFVQLYAGDYVHIDSAPVSSIG